MKKRLKQLILFCCTLNFLGSISFAFADTASNTETLLNWAESNYPQYFPTHETTQSITPWLFRFYPNSNVYAGVNTNENGVYVFGGPWGNVNPTYIDSLSNLLLTANNGKLTNVKSMVLGSQAFVIKTDGTVWGWGNNGFGQLGDGTKEARSTPVKVIGLTDVASVISGANATIALKNDGTVWAWGWNIEGDLGNGAGGLAALKEFQYTPTQIKGLTDVAVIGQNNTISHTGFYAIKQDGTLWIWGCQANRIIDHAIVCVSSESTRLPSQIDEFSDVIDFQSGPGNGALNSYYVLKSDGTVWAWGSNFVGQLGDGTNSDTILPHGITGSDRDTPEQVAGLTGVKEITVVGTLVGVKVFALKKDGTVWAWGDNTGNQLGTGMTTTTVDKPTEVSELTGIIKISVGTFNTLALKNDGTVWAWGWNNLYGAIGVGTGTSMDIITPIPTPVQLVDLHDIVDIQTSTFASYALKGDGTIWGWGSGFLKTGPPRAEAKYLTPIQMCNLPGITNIIGFGPDYSSYLLRNDGTVWNGYFDLCTQL
ncbi:hypothetical protein [Nitrosomonas sp.]|uniref:RCC1 domain-containing protein n=1 Tax=Nitrosomonas sp. TaxID=42353 RepID=UPI0025DDCEDD|nr:hypothetical protein [Nitrosomonas sp.]